MFCRILQVRVESYSCIEVALTLLSDHIYAVVHKQNAENNQSKQTQIETRFARRCKNTFGSLSHIMHQPFSLSPPII